MKKAWQHYSAVVRKETTMLIRDKFTLYMLISIPILELFLLAYSATFTVKHIPLAVYTESNEQTARDLVDAFSNSEFFDVAYTVHSEAEVIEKLNSGAAKAGLIIPQNFESQISRSEANVQLLLDGSDLYTLSSSEGAAQAILANLGLELTIRQLQENETTASAVSSFSNYPIVTSVQTLYNPNRGDLEFIIPGIVAIIIQMFAITGIATTIVRERELGSAEQLLATPIRPMENILGKMTPYLGLTLVEMLLIHALGVFWFKVAFNGNFLVYFLVSVLFSIASLGVGLVVSSIAQNENQVMQITALFILFSFMITGLIFSRLPMPWWTKLISDCIPMTYFLPIIRGFMVKGTGLAEASSSILSLAIFCLVILVLLPRLSKKRLD